MIKNYNKYINESILDKLKGPTLEEMEEFAKNDPKTLMETSIKQGYIDGVNRAIEKGVDLNYYFSNYLHLAVIYGRYEIVEILLNKGIEFRESSISAAYENGYDKIAELILTYFNYTFKSFIEKFPNEHLRISIHYNKIDEVKKAIKNGANVNKSLANFLFNALLNKRNDIAKCLIVHGATVDDQLITHVNNMKNPEMIEFFNKYY